MTLIFQILDKSDFRSKSENSAVSAKEAASIINRWENFGLWVLDIDSGQLRWTERTFEIFGMKGRTNPVNFKEVAACYHPDDSAVRLELLEMAAKNRSGYHSTLRIKDGEGGYKLIRSVAQFKLDKNDRPVLYGMVHNVGPIDFEPPSLRVVEPAELA